MVRSCVLVFRGPITGSPAVSCDRFQGLVDSCPVRIGGAFHARISRSYDTFLIT
jgi:hypothetical protein